MPGVTRLSYLCIAREAFLHRQIMRMDSVWSPKALCIHSLGNNVRIDATTSFKRRSTINHMQLRPTLHLECSHSGFAYLFDIHSAIGSAHRMSSQVNARLYCLWFRSNGSQGGFAMGSPQFKHAIFPRRAMWSSKLKLKLLPLCLFLIFFGNWNVNKSDEDKVSRSLGRR